MLSNQRKRRVVHNAYVDVDSVTEQAGLNCNNWIEITKHKLQERESKLLNVIKVKIESIVNETLNLHATSANPQSFVVSNGIIAEALSVFSTSINQWKGINLSRLKKPPKLYRDYYTVSKKSWDRRKTKLFGAALWVNVFKQIHQFVWMNMYTLIHILQALFCAVIKYSNTKAQALISGTIMCESREFQEYLTTLHPSFRIHEWIAALDKKHVAKSLQQKMQSHLSLMLDQSVGNSNGGEGVPQMDDYDAEERNNEGPYHGYTSRTSIGGPLPSHTQQPPSPQPQPQPQRFVVDPSVVNGGPVSMQMEMEMDMQQNMDEEPNTGHPYYGQPRTPSAITPIQWHPAYPQPTPPSPQPQPQPQQNFVLNPSVVNAGGIPMAVQQMDVDETNGRQYDVYTRPVQSQPPQPPPQNMMNSQNGSSDMMMMQPNAICNNYSGNPYPSGDYNNNMVSNGSGGQNCPQSYCYCCNCNQNVERSLSITNSNSNYNADQLLSGYSSNANPSTSPNPSFMQSFGTPSLSNNNNNNNMNIAYPTSPNMGYVPSVNTMASTPPLSVYNGTINNPNNDMFYDDNTLNEMNAFEMNTFEMNDYGLQPTAHTASTPFPDWL